ncbi:unnamed protein product [Darwinula stevensoni]|uniref:non-specific serine/threonine protein kinase n=1 Tax=Darwinula stevensoni TaxID=69355 RepID=A0A7R8XB85_9CRUS|nr:unnamed protein product [Darwinula stevensoni]CAG0886357.1 unnamed protein product [Darwinula stevensoni]
MESRVLALLSHPLIVQYYDSFVLQNEMVLVMEYLQGGTLDDFLQSCAGNLLPEQARSLFSPCLPTFFYCIAVQQLQMLDGKILWLFAQMCIALQHIHSKQILHRDLKTRNILLDRDRHVAKIGDFGISKILNSRSKALTVVGTLPYMSPELCQEKPYNQKSDVWALGCMLYEMASLKQAFAAHAMPALLYKITQGTVAPIPSKYSPHLKSLVHECLQQEPECRPSAEELLAHPLLVPYVLQVYLDVGMTSEFKPMWEKKKGAGGEAAAPTS